MEEAPHTAHKVVEIMDGMTNDTVETSEDMEVGATVGEDTARLHWALKDTEATVDRKVATTRNQIKDTLIEEDIRLRVLTVDKLGAYAYNELIGRLQ